LDYVYEEFEKRGVYKEQEEILPQDTVSGKEE